MDGELKNPLLYKKIVIPIIGPNPNTKSTNFAEFFVWPNSWFFLFDLAWTFFDFFFFMKHTIIHNPILKDFDTFLSLKISLT